MSAFKKQLLTSTLLAAATLAPSYINAQEKEQLFTVAAEDTEANVQMNFKDTPLETILNHISKAGGISVINDNTIDSQLTLISQNPLTLKQAISLLNKSLYEKGYTAVQSNKTLKIVTLAQVKHERIPVLKAEKLEDIPDNKDFTVCVIPVNYASASDLRKDLDALINKEHAVLVANNSSNSILLTDANDNIRRIFKIIKAVDTAGAFEAHVKVIQLENANAKDTAKVIESVFISNQSSSSSSRSSRGGRSSRGRGGSSSSFREMMIQRFNMGGGGGKSSAGGPAKGVEIKVTADERSNKLIITGPESSLGVIEKMVKQLDADDAVRESVEIYKARYMKAKELETLLNKALGQQSTTRTESYSRRNNRQTSTTKATGITGSGATAELLGNVYVVSDKATNTLMIVTPPQNVKRVMSLLEELDKPIQQVLIKVLIAEITHDDKTELGVEFGATNTGNVVGSSAITDFNLTPPSAEGLIWRQLDKNWNVTLRSLQTQGKLDILSRPYILASENVEASITVGQRVPLITSTRYLDNGDPISNYDHEDVGIILNVTPTINRLGIVTMDVAPEISAISPTSIPISADASAPVITTREAKTRVSIKSGQTIIIGGMMQDQLIESVKKVPVLGDIPGLGKLFTSIDKTKSKTELLIFITPQVVENPVDLEEFTQTEYRNTKLLPNAFKKGQVQQYINSLKHQEEGMDTLEGSKGSDKK